MVMPEEVEGITTYSKSYISVNVSIIDFEEMIATSLTGCKPVLAVLETSYLPYYQGNSFGHYVSVDYINRTTNKVRIVDCHFDSSYYGVHYVDLEDLYNACCGGWLIL